MPELFKRRARLAIGPPSGDLKSWEGLRVTFNVTKTLDSQPNKAVIKINNLNRDSRSRIQRKRDIVRLEVAYGNDPYEVIFKGEIRHIDHKKERAEIITKIESGDGDTAWNRILLNETIGPGNFHDPANYGVDVSQIFSRLKQIFKTEMREIFGTVTDGGPGVIPNFDSIIEEVSQKATSTINGELLTSGGKYRKGITLNGDFGDVMEKLSSRVGIDFWFNNQDLYVLKRTDTLNMDPIFLAPHTGLLGSPRTLEDGSIQIKSLIVPGLLAGREIVVESREVLGLGGYKITRVSLNGDTRGPNWEATIDAELLGAEAAA